MIDDVSDDVGWERVKKSLSKNIGTNTIPVIYIDEIEKDNTLVLRHEHETRDLDLEHAEQVVKHVNYLWGDHTKLFTMIEGELWEI